MKTLLKISDEHYIIVDNVEPKNENDFVGCLSTHYNNPNHPIDKQINPIRNWSEKDECKVCFKITHSTKPLSEACGRCNGFCIECLENTIPLELKDVLIVTREKASFIELRIAELQKLVNYARDQFSKGLIEAQILYWNQLLKESEQKYSEEEIDVVLNGWTNEVYFGHVRTNFIERLQNNKKPKISWDVDFNSNNKLILI